MENKAQELALADRLIIAIDIAPRDCEVDPLEQVILREVRSYAESGITVKFNSVLRLLGYDFITTIRDMGLKVFADLKLNDIPNTLKTDGDWLDLFGPDLVTVMCSTGVEAMEALTAELSNTEVLGVTTLTSLDDDACRRVFNRTPLEETRQFAELAAEAKIGGLILSPEEVKIVRNDISYGFTYTCPGIRPKWYQDANDDQKRVMTPEEAIAVGADRLVIGRPIRQSKDPQDAIKRTLEEIQKGLEARSQNI